LAATCRRTGSLTSGPKRSASQSAPKLFVRVVDAAAGGILAQPMDHVADIMKQAGKHGRGRRLVGLGQCGGLQRMLQLD
jgi:hypothetical protein